MDTVLQFSVIRNFVGKDIPNNWRFYLIPHTFGPPPRNLFAAGCHGNQPDKCKHLALLVAVASVQIQADRPKKKIRIHLPQTVKHIHHHKKIYITNHPASSQYAPAFMPNAEGAVAVPTNIALPTVANIVPFNSVDILEDSVRTPGLTASASKLIPLYHARGYYGPTHTEIDEQEFDLASIPEPGDSYVFPSPIIASPQDTNHHSSKRIKVVKVSEPPRKKIIRKAKPKRIPVRKPVTTVQQENELPVSTFHEQFYSDVQDAGTIRKFKKPQRFEKIVDGNTEHIHTYSEEHIHKVVFDEEPKYTGIVGLESISGIPAYTHPLLPLKQSQILAMPSDPYRTVAIPGSMGTPAQYEYAAYNPREVTHDHFFHDHGEIPEEVDITRDIYSIPPKVTYNSQGIRIDSPLPKRVKNKYTHRPTKTSSGDYTYYENVYSSSRVKPTKTAAPAPLYVSQNDNGNQFKSVSTYRYKDGVSSKARNKIPTYFGKPTPDYRVKKPSNVPYSVSSKIVHEYKPTQQSYSGTAPGSNGLSAYEDQFANFKDSFVNNYEYDNYASSSNVHQAEEKNHHHAYGHQGRKGRKKSISSQNIRFGRQNGKYSENFANENILVGDNDGAPSALDGESYDEAVIYDSATSASLTGKESSPYQYYTVMAVKSLADDQLTVPEASNNNYQYAEAPTPAITPNPTVATTTTLASELLANQNNFEFTTRPTEIIKEHKYNKKYPENNAITVTNAPPSERHRGLKEMKNSDNFHKIRLQSSEKYTNNVISTTSTERSQVKYGDKI
ncbi:hypothetical protein RR48_15370 [Papilio machaon]|uniref:Uncharacterized protein n=1 Tax=Papilio machaon TaxID=76193 RepID=A0A194QV85_PAPMA|nr:hypothetical protein RR48_15370 [Papilio machaon]